MQEVWAFVKVGISQYQRCTFFFTASPESHSCTYVSNLHYNKMEIEKECEFNVRMCVWMFACVLMHISVHVCVCVCVCVCDLIVLTNQCININIAGPALRHWHQLSQYLWYVITSVTSVPFDMNICFVGMTQNISLWVFMEDIVCVNTWG